MTVKRRLAALEARQPPETGASGVIVFTGPTPPRSFDDPCIVSCSVPRAATGSGSIIFLPDNGRGRPAEVDHA